MNAPAITITLNEWETRRPDRESGLEGRSLESQESRDSAEKLAAKGMLEVMELRTGLLVRTFSHVGRVRLGDIEITVLPKLDRPSLLNLLRYAYGLRKLALFDDSPQWLARSGFADLLVSQLAAEVEELVARGLHRSYVPKKEWLSAPRGRIDIQRIAAQGGVLTASLPCTFHPRIEDTLLNQVLLAGLRLAGTVAGDIQLRRRVRRLAGMFEEQVRTIRLDAGALEQGSRCVNRLTAAYGPAFTLIRLLWESQGITLEEADTTLRLPGFLFDMNRFFQALLSRFLRDNLPNYTLRDEFRLRGMMQFVPGFYPRWGRPPTPRPDFVVMQGTRVKAILDAKYRDLWEKRLPDDMLYQLAIYAASHELKSATILYPTTYSGATEARISIHDSVIGRQVAQVRLRPVVLAHFEALILKDRSADAERKRKAYAEWLALGAGTPST